MEEEEKAGTGERGGKKLKKERKKGERLKDKNEDVGEKMSRQAATGTMYTVIVTLVGNITFTRIEI